MNKLLYREIIRHINHSVIKNSTVVATQQAFTVTNPATELTLLFNKIECFYPSETKYTIFINTTACVFSKIFTTEQLKQLFEAVHNRYETHFKNHSDDTLNVYRQLLASNNKSR